ncbi:MAG: hypothetical protein HZC55_27005 [Verrucomicrobia bacterium]|nr:hypothetical protein [Verrucomicrobiota bacterium]
MPALALLLLRAAAIGGLIALGEVIHGAWRVRFLNRRLGDRRARQVGVLTGSLLFFGIAWLTLPWVAPRSIGECLGTGAVWVTLLLALDVYFGRWVFHFPWDRILAEFNPRRGGLLGFGLLALGLTPWIVAKLQGRL